MTHTMRDFQATKNLEVTTDNEAAHYLFQHIEDYGNGYRMRSFVKDADGFYVKDWEFTVYSNTKTRAVVLAEFGYIIEHLQQD